MHEAVCAILLYTYTCIYELCLYVCVIQGGEDPQDALSCRVFLQLKAFIIGLFCGTWPIKISHPIDLRHPVLLYTYTLVHLRIVSVCTCTHSSMGWLWLVGSLKIWISSAEYSLFYRALLQKRPVFLGSLLIVATPYYNLSMWHTAVDLHV